MRGIAEVLAVGLLGAASGAGCASVPEPEPLGPPGPHCALFEGLARGNNDAYRLRLALCPGGEAGLRGEIQVMSPASGWSVRNVSGTVGPDGVLWLRDTGFVEQFADDGWEFCSVDRYALRLAADGVAEGTFESRPCRDHGALVLRRVQ